MQRATELKKTPCLPRRWVSAAIPELERERAKRCSSARDGMGPEQLPLEQG